MRYLGTGKEGEELTLWEMWKGTDRSERRRGQEEKAKDETYFQKKTGGLSTLTGKEYRRALRDASGNSTDDEGDHTSPGQEHRAMGGASSEKRHRDTTDDEEVRCSAPNYAKLVQEPPAMGGAPGRKEEKRASGERIPMAPAGGILSPKKRAREDPPAVQVDQPPLQYIAVTNERLRKENTHFRKKLADMEKELKEAQRRQGGATADHAQCRETEAKLQRKLETSEEDLVKAKHENHSLAEELKRAEDSKKSAWDASRESATYAAKYKQRVVEWQAIAARLERERGALRQDKEKMIAEIGNSKRAKRDVYTLKEEKEKLVQENEKLVQENKNLKKVATHLKVWSVSNPRKAAGWGVAGELREMIAKIPVTETVTETEYDPTTPAYTPSKGLVTALPWESP